MMTIKSKPLLHWCAAIVCLLMVSVRVAAAPSETELGSNSPLGEVKDTINTLVEVVATYPGDQNLTERRSKLREAIEPKFDFREMAKRSLGAYWREISVEQQSEFVNVFSDLLANTYLARIEYVRADTVKVDSERVTTPTALVKTTVTHKGDKFPIDYKLVNVDKRWKVYDVVIENIGLVANYRNEFAGIIRKEQFSGLMKRLKEKVSNLPQAS